MPNPFKRLARYAGDHLFGSGRGPFHEDENPPLVRPPAGGPGTVPGQQQPFPIGDHRPDDGNIQQNPTQPTGVTTSSGSAATGNEVGGMSWQDRLKKWGGDAAKAFAEFMQEHGGQALDLGLGTAGMINSANLAAKSSDYANKSYGYAEDSYKTREPLRLAGVEGMLRPVPSSDVSNLGAGSRAANPFARQGPIPFQHALVPPSPGEPYPPGPSGVTGRSRIGEAAGRVGDALRTGGTPPPPPGSNVIPPGTIRGPGGRPIPLPFPRV